MGMRLDMHNNRLSGICERVEAIIGPLPGRSCQGSFEGPAELQQGYI
jgi:hypothetical protein